MKLICISGSLRKQSLNTRLLNSLKSLSSDQVELSVAGLQDVPLYNGDDEKVSGIPDAIVTLREAIKQSDGIILATPEYNGGIPGVLKNALDWLTRPPEEMAPTFFNRPLALCGATPGGLGTALAQSGSLTILRQLKVALFPDHLRVSKAHERLDPDTGPDDKMAEQLKKWLNEYTNFIDQYQN